MGVCLLAFSPLTSRHRSRGEESLSFLQNGCRVLGEGSGLVPKLVLYSLSSPHPNLAEGCSPPRLPTWYGTTVVKLSYPVVLLFSNFVKQRGAGRSMFSGQASQYDYWQLRSAERLEVILWFFKPHFGGFHLYRFQGTSKLIGYPLRTSIREQFLKQLDLIFWPWTLDEFLSFCHYTTPFILTVLIVCGRLCAISTNNTIVIKHFSFSPSKRVTKETAIKRCVCSV